MSHRLFFWAYPTLALTCVGCSGTDAPSVAAESGSYETLFDPPTTAQATPDDIHGLWGARIDLDPSLETRWRIDDKRIVIGLRCYDAAQNFVTVGVSIAVRIENGSIFALESKSDVKPRPDGRSCRVNSSPSTSDYSLAGTTLTVRDQKGISQRLVKISD